MGLVARSRLRAGCSHVRRFGSDGYAIDGQARVCSPECASQWAAKYGKVHIGESTTYDAKGKVLSRVYQSGFSDH